MTFKLRYALAAFCVAGIAACGGGGGSSSEPSQTGQLLEPVAGLDYETSTGLKGITNSQGQFSYRAGDRISFSAGKISLGEMSASPVVTMAGLANASADDAKVLNLIQLLQTLDEDKNPANGISLSDTTRSKLSALASPMNAQTLSDSDLQTKIVDVVFGSGARTLA
jgi:hypothetical protein